MATSNTTGVASESEGLVHLLEQTIHARVLKDLEDPLAEIVHGAVRDAIVTASKNVTLLSPASKKTKSISRPVSGGRCAKVWDELDKLVSNGKTPTLQDIQKLAKRKHFNGNTARIQFYRWRSATTQATA